MDVVGWGRGTTLVHAFVGNGKCVRRCKVADCLESVSSAKPVHFSQVTGGP
jgi:hypothetical protein